MDIGMIIEVLIKSLILVLFLTLAFAYITVYERRLLAKIQVRIGPNRTGPWGLLQPIADAIKLIFKEELTPAGAIKSIFFLAPIITVMPALIIPGVIPWGRDIQLFGRTIHLYIADINVAVLYILSITSIAVYGITLAGWSSNNKYATLGGLRSTAQMISYELSMGFALMGPVMLAGSLSVVDIVESQTKIWYVFLQPVAAVIFFIAMLAEINRSPFDMPEAEQELTAGYHAEYSGMKFAVFFMAEYIKMFVVSMIFSSLFLGGYLGPWVDKFNWLGPIYLLAKVIICMGVIIWIRATIPRFRYDRLMAMGWKVLFPAALASTLITAFVILVTGG
jgi:NADH-quinone oxidoreductase subunit H